jgi:diguanylate cyclase (GGDEF)-like protein
MRWWRRVRHLFKTPQRGVTGSRAVALPLLLTWFTLHLVISVTYVFVARTQLTWLPHPSWLSVIYKSAIALGAPIALGVLWYRSRPSRRVVRVGDWFGAGILAHSVVWLGGAVLELIHPGNMPLLGHLLLEYSLGVWGVASAVLFVRGTIEFSRQLSTELRERRRLEALIDFTRRITSLDYQRILDEAVGHLHKILEADSCMLYLWNEEEQVLVPVAGKHDPTVYTEAYIRRMMSFHCPLGFGITGWVMQTGLPYIADNVMSDSHSQAIPGWAHDEKSSLLAPIQVEGRRLGVVRLTRRGLNQFEQDDLDLALSFTAQAAMVIEHGRIIKELSELSITDNMTGLFNARHFQHVLAMELSRADRSGQPLALLMLDSDSLKAFNDRLGHQKGDEYIRMIGRVLKSSLRLCDYAFRYAGDEFLVLLPGTGQDEAMLVAERIRQYIEENEAIVGTGGTVSLGVAVFPTHASDGEGLLSMADRAMYESKRQGKNRVTPADMVLSRSEAVHHWNAPSGEL